MTLQLTRNKTDTIQHGLSSLSILWTQDEAESVPIWQPNPPENGSPNPQQLALDSEADELWFGGAAGGGKSDLILGMALSVYKQSVVFRRNYTLLKELIRRSIKIVGSSKEYNKSDKVWNLDGRIVEFGAMEHEDDKENWQGRPHGLKCFDEITQFSQSQYLYPIAWTRSTDPTEPPPRVVVTGNPPIHEAGNWVLEAWGPWVQPEHEFKAEPGELRWYYYDDDFIVWLRSGEEIEIHGLVIKPRSRTFIPSKLQDNPYLRDTTYASVLNSLPEELRVRFLDGDMLASVKTNPWQVIPTAWVKLAQQRWLERPKPDMPLSGVGVDMVRGGIDKMTISKRYGTWFDEIIAIPGVDVEDGPQAAGFLFQALENEEHIGYINIDIIGWGSSGFDSSIAIWPDLVKALNAAERSDYIVMSKGDNPKQLFTMKNKRAEMHWRLREALDPVHGDDLAIPPGNDIIADLCSANYQVMAGGIIQIEKKEEIKKRLGRSPDKGECIMFSYMPAQEKKAKLTLSFGGR